MNGPASAVLAAADVLSEGSPEVPLAWAMDLLAQQYGLAGRLSPLSGERDQNFLLETPAASYMLKVSHPAELPLVADFQTQALLHIAAADPALPVQRIMPTLAGRPSLIAQPPGGEARVVRLFSYLPGEPLPKARRSPAQARELARTLARLDLALRDFRHPAGELELPWDIQRAGRVRGLLDSVPDERRRALATRALDRFAANVQPRLARLRAQPIHNDFNIYNVLVDPQDHARIAGVLDFGDMVHAPLIDDLAVAAAYQVDPAGDTLATLADFAAAYHAVLPLQADEIDVLFDLVQARLVMVVAISGWRAARHPENAPYLLRNNAVSWDRLAACDAIPTEQARIALRRACGLA
ncbi:aminoglycoside phosphotransferase [Cupriavidus basilensis OR16]|uniref:Hydroxylysine kinase n=1 Tax=Cupriavidus basilensis OR16 TaxID=1127483 RepID=H1SCV7_9BURK|nr:phosphotransferase [Cupriavidus basilensis]EHP39603.1 aminoglycoside phosphotransferase [Cupriavidus basilensis OR16]